MARLTQEFDVHQNQIVDRKKQSSEQAVEVFGKADGIQLAPVDLPVQHGKIGQQTLQNDFLLALIGWSGR
ncbi:MAG: hypothetical protein M0R33_11435 [Methylomonas sp.]|uniref:hypothetical protein n=1 Tax=Methylomonas sp. TaxID=418 RepID=UPI0025F5986E|nr:hypothetical protein [Methylomonas sp.]MCK9607046.1 hypothetical protein [Methylomonas sp.]